MKEQLKATTLNLVINSKGGNGKTYIAKLLSEYFHSERFDQKVKRDKDFKIGNYFMNIRSNNNVFQHSYKTQSSKSFFHFQKTLGRRS